MRALTINSESAKTGEGKRIPATQWLLEVMSGSEASLKMPIIRIDSAEVRRVFDDITRYEDGTPRTKHVISNLTVELAGDTATSRCYFTVLQAAPDGPLVAILAGRYHDRFERVDGQWRFVDRLIHPDLFGDLGGHMRQGAGSSPDP